MNHPLLDDLNDAQAAVVSAPNGHCLVLAGAGSGKTRVLVHRVAWLLDEEHVRPSQILAVTFTNKAAAEMRERLEGLRPGVHGYWVGTFHGLAHRLLRLHPLEAGLPETFQVLDADDQTKLIRQIVKDMQLDDELFVARQITHWISSQKDEGRTPQDVKVSNSIEQTLAEVFQVYQERCNLGGLVDFAELLLRAHALLKNTPALLHHYQNRFSNLLVDEFQDTNAIQYDFIRLLAGSDGKVFVVGDDDQSIYGWRGAKVENIQHFLQDYAGAELFKLEENYRSTGVILEAANELISSNDGRLGKNLWTQAGEGEKIDLHECLNEVDEAQFVVKKIRGWVRGGGKVEDCAVLYRSNAQSRAIEEQLIAASLPYRIYGGLKFFDRAEIKDAMAYLRLVASRRDDAAFERVVNVPTRGLGDKSLQKVRDIARKDHIPMWSAARQALDKGLLSGKAALGLEGFLNGIDELEEETRLLPLDRVVGEVLEWSGLRPYHSKEGKADKDSNSRVDNLDELISVADRFALPEDEARAGMSDLVAFLAHASLEAGEHGTGNAEDQPSVQLMTIHAAKGLEFPLVFMVGMEEGLFPNQKATLEDGRLDEERRLAYVGITRAMKKLVMSYAKERRLHGQWIHPSPSSFLSEIPSRLVAKTRSVAPPNSGPGRYQGLGMPSRGQWNDRRSW